MPTDDPILAELFKVQLFSKFMRALHVHEAARAAFRERTGLEYQPDSELTLEDIRRADRILKANRHPGIGC